MVIGGPSVKRYYLNKSLPEFESVIGNVISTGVHEVEPRRATSKIAVNWMVEIKYTYVVSGVKYNGARYALNGNPTFGNSTEAYKLSESYQIGKNIAVYYAKSNPENGVLVPKNI